MNYVIPFIIVLTSFSFRITGCGRNEKVELNTTSQVKETLNPTNGKMKITIGTSVFTATFYDNPTAIAFKSMLPITIQMDELNGNEKYFYFSDTLPTNASPGGTIQNGDLMLYGNNCLVLFYEGFTTSYKYSRIGKITNTAGLAHALGKGNVEVKFEL